MEINELMMLTNEDIDYNILSLDALKQLALSDELFIATSALGELSRKNSSIAASTAWEILSNSRGDCYLQAAALETIFEYDQEKELTYISEQVTKLLLEGIKLSELPSVYLLDKDRLPNCAAIYFVCDSKSQILLQIHQCARFAQTLRPLFLSLRGIAKRPY